MDIGLIQRAFTYFVAMLFCLTFHEAAHALAAKWQGDTTAEDEGRLSLNPLVHLDILGTVVLPLIGALGSMPMLGWAKPVPVNPRNFKSVWGNVLVAVAGPGSNLLLCAICLFVLVIAQKTGITSTGFAHLTSPFVKLLEAMVGVNAILAVFNMIPLPPLDGAAVLEVVLPRDWVRVYEERVAPYGIFILFLLAFSGGLGWIAGLAQAYIHLTSIFVSLVVGAIANVLGF